MLLLAVVLVNLTPVQNYLARKGAEYLSKRLKTKVTVAHIRIDFLNHILIQGLYIEDQKHDTLLYAGEAQVRITDWFIFKDRPTLHYLGLENAYAHLYRTPESKIWNYAFIEDAFSTNTKDTSKGKTIKFDLKKVALENVRIHMDDQWVGENLDFDVSSLALNAKELDFDKKLITVDDIAIRNSDVSVKEYKGGRPKKVVVDTVDNGPDDVESPTIYNVDKWLVKVNGLSLNSCTFHLTGNDNVPVPDLFDENHLVVSKIDLAASNIYIIGDTIHGNIDRLSAQERCGLAIKKMHSKVSVSPVASICENLYLETNYSKVQNYYAMHYKEFPDFIEYIDSVVMVAHVKDAVIDERDIAYFAPQLKNFPKVILHVSGDGKGTVANLSGQHLVVSDGSSSVKGNVTMKGLPDIYTTNIHYDGELLTTGNGILRYVPGLKNSPNVALEQISIAWFKGSYDGRIEDFAVNGVLNTNLGLITTSVKMTIPGFSSNTAVYSGKVKADNVQIGTFLKQPLLGNITLNENFSGSSFDPENVQLKIDGKISEFTIKNYPYQNISTNGIIAKKEFTGDLTVDDPNLGLDFHGDFNYINKNIEVKATAHLKRSNFYALKLTADTVKLIGDFDLDCTGSNIDNFSGYAKFRNIVLLRNAHKLAVDSILITATGDSLHKHLSVRSNDLTASINGNYQLSKLPASIQFYLSRYIPNYIKAPANVAPAQNFEFTASTFRIDRMLAVSFPFIRGFDSSAFSGSLNTTTNKLTLNASVPNGTIGSFHMNNISVTGLGNLNNLLLSTTIDNVGVGDSFINGSLGLTATIANDSVSFTVATTTPDTSSSITLNGQIVARKDSLFLNLKPSQFYLNQVKWDIAGGSSVVYSDKYLLVEGFSITSGLQKISAATQLQNNDKSLLINTENLDLGQFGSWAGLATYQPDGRLNGTIRIDKIFRDMFISANLIATDVKLGADTVGTINIIGYYDGAKKLINFDTQTGIYRGNAAITAAGNISFDSSTHEKLDGVIQFTNAPVVWASPFVAGIMSHLSGAVNGSINFSGTSFHPELKGDLVLTTAGLHLDYMGTNYTIPYANVHIDNKLIELGKVYIFDAHQNTATLTGNFSHNLFKKMQMNLHAVTDKMEVMNLTANDNSIFYGNVTASAELTLKGYFNDIRLNIYNVAPAGKSRIFIPVSTGGEVGTYSYVGFKTYGRNQEKYVKKSRDKFHVIIDGNLNTDAEMIVVLDPTNGDAIRAKGYGNIRLDIPPDNDVSINGQFMVDNGTYNFTLNQLFLKKEFILDEGSTINFTGPFSGTYLEANAHYRTKAKLSDLYSVNEQATLESSDQTAQWVKIQLHMNGLLSALKMTFDLDLEDKHNQNTLAYQKLMRINSDPREKLNQVTALLLVSQFLPPEGVGADVAKSGVVNNFSQLLSSSMSTGLTGIINKLTHDKDLNIVVNYKNYNYSDQFGGINRNQVKVDVNKSLINERLIVEVGSTSDWGRPTNTNATSSFNFTGDFRLQYKVTQTSNLRITAFRTSDYDVTLDKDIARGGVGVTWRKSFDNLGEFFHGKKYARKQKDLELKKMQEEISDTIPIQSNGIQ